MIHYSEFQSNLDFVRDRVSQACAQSSRDANDVTLLPVTKNHPVDAVVYAHKSGLVAVGENRVQEAMLKREETDLALRWELIGHLQSNKAKVAVAAFDRIQSVDSLKLIERLGRHAKEVGRVLPILLQCNAGEDPNKYGFSSGDMKSAVEQALAQEHLQLDGLMTIAPLNDDIDVARRAFFRLRELRDSLAAEFRVPLGELSMGMTGDLEHAIEAGSTQIRVGSALYGERH